MKKMTLRVFLFAVLGLLIVGTALLSKTESDKYINAPTTGVAEDPEPEVVYCAVGDGVEKDPEPEVVYCAIGDGVEKDPEPEVVYCAVGDGVEKDPEPEVVYCGFGYAANQGSSL